MPKLIKQKALQLQLACVQVRYGVTKNSHIFPMEYNICTDKLPSAATVHFLWAKRFVHACHYKGLSCSKYKAKVYVNILYYRYCFNSASMNFYNLTPFKMVSIKSVWFLILSTDSLWYSWKQTKALHSKMLIYCLLPLPVFKILNILSLLLDSWLVCFLQSIVGFGN